MILTLLECDDACRQDVLKQAFPHDASTRGIYILPEKRINFILGSRSKILDDIRNLQVKILLSSISAQSLTAENKKISNQSNSFDVDTVRKTIPPCHS